MERQEAIDQAHDYLKRGNVADTLKERARRNEDLTYMGLAHVIADVIQRGVDPKDIDFDKVDWGVSYSNIRNQVQDLADKKGGSDFETEKRDKRESGMAEAEQLGREKQSDRLVNKAKLIQRGRSKWERYTDQTRDAETVHDKPINEEEYKKWRRNPDKQDIEGVDDRRPESQRPDISRYPFEKSIAQRKKEQLLKNTGADPGSERPDQFKDYMSKREALRFRGSEKGSSSRNSNSLELNSKLDELMELKNVYDAGDKGVISRKQEIASRKEDTGKENYIQPNNRNFKEKAMFSGVSEAEKETKFKTEKYAKRLYRKGKGDKTESQYSNSSSGNYIKSNDYYESKKLY